MKVYLTFISFIFIFSFQCFAEDQRADIPCDQFTVKIEEKIRMGFEEAKSQANNGGQCNPSVFGAAAQNTVARCHQLIAQTDNYCRSIHYDTPQATQGGAGTQGLHASNVLDAAADKFDNESIRCGEQLASIPKECKRLGAQYRSQIVSAGCNAEQIGQAEEESVQRAVPQIVKFCQTANYYKNAQADHFRMIGSEVQTTNGIVDPTQGHNL